MSFFLSPVLNEQQFDANGDPLDGGLIYTYLAGTTTPVTTYKTSTGTAQANPIVLDSSGNFPSGTQLWLQGGSSYKFEVQNSAAVPLRTYDNIMGVNDANSGFSEWNEYTASAFSYLSATSFTVVGDQTGIFEPNRRIQTANTGGTIYSTIVSSSYSAPNTTVTVQNDSGALDAGLSALYFSILSVSNSALPQVYLPELPRVDVASAATVDLSTLTSRNIQITGTTTISSFTIQSGKLFFVRFSGALTLTNNASIITQTGGNILTAAGDTCIIRATANNIVEVLSYAKVATNLFKGIQSLTATVAANALTINLAATTLDFRSATLTDGAPIPNVDIPALSITIPNGATMGGVNGVAQRLVVEVAYNGGSPVLCVSGMNGLNLDETTLISPTTISTGSDSANVIYSASSVGASSPFRVVGFVDITEATAGVWATGPTRVQGVGGQALAALSSVGYGQTWQDFTGSRVIGTTYYNTTGKPRQIKPTVSSTGSGGLIIAINGVSAGFIAHAFSTSGAQYGVGSMIIQPGDSYAVTVAASSGVTSIFEWFESI